MNVAVIPQALGAFGCAAFRDAADFYEQFN
jgi:hypothetical protein